MLYIIVIENITRLTQKIHHETKQCENKMKMQIISKIPDLLSVVVI